MKKLSLILLFMSTVFCALLAQEQLSNFDYQVPTSEFEHVGIEQINGTNYLIESNNKSLRVTQLDSVPQVLYTVMDYMQAGQIHGRNGELNTRSGYEVDSIYLYELFTNKIRKRNLITSEIEDVFEFENGELTNVTSFEVLDSMIYFEKWDEYNRYFYNTSSGQYSELDILYTQTQRHGHIYFAGHLIYDLISLDARDSLVTPMFQNELISYTSFGSHLTDKTGIIFGNETETHFFHPDTTFQLSCPFYETDEREIYVMESHSTYVGLYDDQHEVTMKILDKSDCSVLSTSIFETDQHADHIKIFDIPSLGDQYLFFVIDYKTYREAHFFLFDKLSGEVHEISTPDIREIEEFTFYRWQDELYFIGLDSYEPHGYYHLYALHLPSQSMETLQGFPSFSIPKRMGPGMQDSTFLIGIAEENTVIFNFKNKEESNLIFQTADTRNFGIANLRYLGDSEENIAFLYDSTVYLVDQNLPPNEKIIEITKVDGVSDFIKIDETYNGLIEKDNTIYRLSIDLHSHHVTMDEVDEYYPIDVSSTHAGEYIFGQFSLSEKKYFDISSNQFLDIPLTNEILSMQVSKDVVLFTHGCDAGFCLTQFHKDNWKTINTNFATNPHIYAKGDGQFILVEEQGINNHQLTVLNRDGLIADQIEVQGEPFKYNQAGIEKGALSALMFYDDEHHSLDIYMHRYNDIHHYSIPFEGSEHYKLQWTKTNNTLLVKSNDTNAPGLYLCALGQELVKIETESFDYSYEDLLFADENMGTLRILTAQNFWGTNFTQYKLNTGEIEVFETDLSLNYAPEYLHTALTYKEGSFLLSFVISLSPDEIAQDEFYELNLDNNTLVMHEDINQNQQTSNPHLFLESSHYSYFVARSPSDNSYQFYSIKKDDLTSTQEIESGNPPIGIFPNPGRNMITLQKDAEALIFYDAVGRLVYKVQLDGKWEGIDISMLENGIYLVQVVQADSVSTVQFVKF